MCHCGLVVCTSFFFFFFNDTATTEIYTLSLHDALPISINILPSWALTWGCWCGGKRSEEHTSELQSRVDISYAVFCLKKKKNKKYSGNDEAEVEAIGVCMEYCGG